jgi:hypothetical protein
MRKIVSLVAGVYGVRVTLRLADGSAGDGMDRHANIESFHEQISEVEPDGLPW